MSELVEAVTEYYGERCPDFEPECACCKAWAEIDRISALEAERDRLREALEELLAHASFVGIAPHYEQIARAALSPHPGEVR